MIVTILRQQPRAAALVLALIAANLLARGWAFTAFGGSGALMAASLLAQGLWSAPRGRRRPYRGHRQRDPQNDAAGEAAFAVGAWFSLGHSSIVVLASAAIAATATAFGQQMSWFHETGSVIGTAVSALFLLVMAFINWSFCAASGAAFGRGSRAKR